MEVSNKPKVLKQGKLSFGQKRKPKILDKENVPLKSSNATINKEIEDEIISTINNDVVFNSILRQKNDKIPCSNLIEVKVDVHQTIQCPEISTSSIESDAEKSPQEIINLIEEDEEENESTSVANDTTNTPMKMSEECIKNIDTVIDSVIERGLNDAESLFSNQFISKENRKRNRAPSPNAGTAIVDSHSPSDKTKENTLSANSTPKKKPRRSILDMLSVTNKSSTGPVEPSSQNDAEPMDVDELDSNASIILDDSSDKSESNVETEKTTTKTALLPKIVISEYVDTIDLCTSEEAVTDDDKSTGADDTSTPNRKEMNELKGKKSPDSVAKATSSRKSAEYQRKKEEREKEREERRKLKEEEKCIREAEKLETKRKKEEDRLQREEEKRKKRDEAEKLKEEKLRKKQEELEKKKAEIEAKRIEKERKDEEKRREKEQREEEKRAKEEERQRILQDKIKAEKEKKRSVEKQVASFKSFFSTPPPSTNVKKPLEKSIGSFISFQLKEDMLLSPQPEKLTQRRKLNLESKFHDQVSSPSYLDELKASSMKRHRPRTIPRMQPKLLSLSDDGVEILSPDSTDNPVKLRVKLLQFADNVRPPYYGTWRKKSRKLKARNPWRKDENLLDYDVDSDDEWEDAGEGEDIANSDGEDEGGEKEDDEDDGDGFFVPHGYLSDDEGINGDEEEDKSDDRDGQRLRMKQQEFENSFKQKIKVLVPLTIGCIWDETEKNCSISQVETLRKYEALFVSPAPISLDEIPALEDGSKSDCKTPSSVRKGFPDEDLTDTSGVAAPAKTSIESSPVNPSGVTSLNPSPRSSPSLVGGVLEKGPHFISKTKLGKKIKEIGIYAKKENYTKSCWLVLDSVFEKSGLDPNDYPIPCKWDYITFDPDPRLCPIEITQPPVDTPCSNDATPKGNIDKFATKLTAEVLLEKSKQRLKQEKEKTTPQPVQVLSKFATAKITPEVLLQSSKQKNEAEEAKQKRRIGLTTISLAGGQSSGSPTSLSNPDSGDELPLGGAASFVVPTHGAFRSFFKLKEHSRSKETPESAHEKGDVAKVDHVEPMDVCPLENADDRPDAQPEEDEKKIDVPLQPPSLPSTDEENK